MGHRERAFGRLRRGANIGSRLIGGIPQTILFDSFLFSLSSILSIGFTLDRVILLGEPSFNVLLPVESRHIVSEHATTAEELFPPLGLTLFFSKQLGPLLLQFVAPLNLLFQLNP